MAQDGGERSGITITLHADIAIRTNGYMAFIEHCVEFVEQAPKEVFYFELHSNVCFEGNFIVYVENEV